MPWIAIVPRLLRATISRTDLWPQAETTGHVVISQNIEPCGAVGIIYGIPTHAHIMHEYVTCDVCTSRSGSPHRWPASLWELRLGHQRMCASHKLDESRTTVYRIVRKFRTRYLLTFAVTSRHFTGHTVNCTVNVGFTRQSPVKAHLGHVA